MKKLNTILFDLDGTLVNSNQLILDAFKHTFGHHFPNKTFVNEDYVNMIGPTLMETFSYYQKEEKKVDEMIQTYLSFYKENEESSIQLYPNLIETLKTLKNNDIKTAIVTTKFKDSAMPSIKLFGLDQYIDTYIFLDDVKNPKPHAEPIQKAIKSIKNTEIIMMVGDNPSDILAGKNAGILTCGVDWSYKKKDLEKIRPDFWIHQFKDLITLIEKYNKEALK